MACMSVVCEKDHYLFKYKGIESNEWAVGDAEGVIHVSEDAQFDGTLTTFTTDFIKDLENLPTGNKRYVYIGGDIDKPFECDHKATKEKKKEPHTIRIGRGVFNTGCEWPVEAFTVEIINQTCKRRIDAAKIVNSSDEIVGYAQVIFKPGATYYDHGVEIYTVGIMRTIYALDGDELPSGTYRLGFFNDGYTFEVDITVEYGNITSIYGME